MLWLWDNPIAQHPLYRQFIIKTLPNLLKLDNTPIGMEERMEIQQMTISDQDIVNGNNEINVNVNKSVSILKAANLVFQILNLNWFVFDCRSGQDRWIIGACIPATARRRIRAPSIATNNNHSSSKYHNTRPHKPLQAIWVTTVVQTKWAHLAASRAPIVMAEPKIKWEIQMMEANL